MARPLRIEFAGAIYHVTARGNERRAIVRDDVDRLKWLSVVERTVDRHGWRVFAFALMDNHFHVFLQTPQPDLSAGMAHLNGSYAGYFNARHGRVGHLMQGRFKSILVEEQGYWLELGRYVHLNPVRAGLARRPEDWPWSSYVGYHRPGRRLDWVCYERVLAEFGGDTPAGRRAYRQYVAEGLERKLDDPLSKAVHGLVLGSDAFVATIRRLVGHRAEDGELPALRLLKRPADMGAVATAVTGRMGGDPANWQAGRRCDDISRAVAAYVARQATSHTSGQIAEALGHRNSSSISVACRRVEQSTKRSASFARQVQAIIADLP